MERVGVGNSSLGPQSINITCIQSHTSRTWRRHTPTHNKTKTSILPFFPKIVPPQLSLSLSAMCFPPIPSLTPYLPTSMFIRLWGPGGSSEGLVKEHGMLMVWKGYE